MAEPTPAYPISEPNPPGPMLTVVAAESRPSVYDQICFRAGRTFQGVKHSAEEAFSRTKRLSARMVEDRPIHLVVGVAVGAFLAGAGLRIWRSYHE